MQPRVEARRATQPRERRALRRPAGPRPPTRPCATSCKTGPHPNGVRYAMHIPRQLPMICRALVVVVLASQATGAQASRGALQPGVVAFEGVNVVPMTSDTIITDVTVIVRDGRIASISPRRDARVPANATRVDGRGKYLSPGFADMHVHLFADELLPESVSETELGVMLANGVTAARLMIGTKNQLRLRREIEAGRVLGPQLWVASPQLAGRPFPNGYTITDTAQARSAVRDAVASGYDFVKLTLFITPPLYDAIVDEARQRGIRAVGHVEPQVGVARALAAGQPIEHLDGYLEAVLDDTVSAGRGLTQQGIFRPQNWTTLDAVDEEKIARLGGMTARAGGWGAWTSPTLNVFNDAFAVGPPEAVLRARPEWDVMPKRWRSDYLGHRSRYWSEEAAQWRTKARRERYVALRNSLVKAIVDSGGHILAGSDTPEWFHLYGWGLHRELRALVTAGLTPYQALQGATSNAATFLGADDQWGTIAPGRRGDLVLLGGNPLADIGATERIEGVMIGGRWLPPARLREMIDEAKRRLHGDGT